VLAEGAGLAAGGGLAGPAGRAAASWPKIASLILLKMLMVASEVAQQLRRCFEWGLNGDWTH
jgi:hypothetical protein